MTENFEAASYIEDEFFKGVEPDSYMSVSDWADEYRVLSSKSASEPGRWRTARTPYLREIMDCLSPKSPIQKVVFMKGAQIGGTECGNNWLGYIMHKAPGPIMAVSPTVEMAKRNSRQRIDPLIEDCPALKGIVSSPRARDKGNTMLSKDFQGGVLVMTGATTFSLPTPSNKNVFNQIKVMMKVTGTPTINWGTINFFNNETPEIKAGNYDCYFDYDNLMNAWVVGVMNKGAAG